MLPYHRAMAGLVVAISVSGVVFLAVLSNRKQSVWGKESNKSDAHEGIDAIAPPENHKPEVTVSAEELGPPEKPAAAIGNDLSERSNDQLIDDLVKIDKPAIGIHPTASARAFLANDEDAEFGGGILGSERPTVVPAMAELVRRGLEVMPVLITHVNDDRPTQLRVSAFAGVAWQDAEYSPRDAKRIPPRVRTRGASELGRTVGEYTVKVGDVCFVLVGQIVNRPLSAVRYQPSGCLVINSPVETPALAAAVRSDWSNLTSEAHRRLLYVEAKGGDQNALARLRFYYPRTERTLNDHLAQQAGAR